MKFDGIKKALPFLANVDFENPQTRRNVILISVAGLMFILLIFLSVLRKPKETIQDSPAPVSTLEIQQGENNDILDAQSTVEVRERRQRTDGSLAGIFSDAALDEDPMKVLTEDESAGRKVGIDVSEVMEKITSAQEEGSESSFGQNMFPGENSVGGGKAAPQAEPTRQGSSSASQGRQAGTAEERVAARKRKLMEEAGLDPDTGQPVQKASGSSGGSGGYSSSSSSSSASSSATASSAPAQPQQEQSESVAPKVSVRKSGEISSLGASRGQGSVGGLGSLKKKDMYVSEDSEHLFKVMFAQNEKISSGQRVTLRLLEDMVIDGILVPANTLVSAIATIGDRLNVSVNSIELNGKIYALNYEGYDTDGARGLYCPHTKAQSTGDEAERQARNIGRTILSSRIAGTAGMAVSAGAMLIENAKGQTTISVASGYTFFLRKKTNN